MTPAGNIPRFMWRKASMPKVTTLISKRFELIPLEVRKLARSFMWSALALLALMVADYLKTGSLDAQLGDMAVFTPFIINALSKWGRENQYKQ